MAIRDSLIEELKRESKNTRTMLERIPEDSFSWKPREKAHTLIQLAGHIAGLPIWSGYIIMRNELDYGQLTEKERGLENTTELLSFFDHRLHDALHILSTASDDKLNTDWTLYNGEHKYFTLSRKVVLRNFVFSQIIHYRGQLSVYLNLLNIPVPGMYEPGLDEIQSPANG